MSQLLLNRYKPSVCIKALLEQTVLLHPLKHYLDNIALQVVVMARKRQLTKEDRQTILTLKSVGLSFGEIAKETKVFVSTVSYTGKKHLETGGNSDRKRSGRPKATTQSEGKFLRVNSLCDRQLT